MDRAFQALLRSSREPKAIDSRTERSITITPQDYLHSGATPITQWREPSCNGRREVEEAYSEDDVDYVHKRKVSELLIKIEKMKRRLLQEYGADLPDDVFNASVRSLFTPSFSSTNHETVERNVPKSAPPDVRVASTSSEETANPPRQTVYRSKKPSAGNKAPVKPPPAKPPAAKFSKPPTKTSSTNTVTTRDQQIQVELEPEKQAVEVVQQHPLEPVVKIVTPENANSSASLCSNSSSATDIVIDINQKGLTLHPKDKENGVKITKEGSTVSSVKAVRHKTPVKISFGQKGGSGTLEVAGLLIDPERKEVTVISKKKKPPAPPSTKPSSESEKSHSLPGSRVGSPVKKRPKSAPSSRHSSPKKSHLRPTKPSDRRDPGIFEEQRRRTQYTQVSIDSSTTESSQLNSTSDTVNGKLYSSSVQATNRLISRLKQQQLQDTSDASTAYASPPSVAAGAMINALSSSTSILELFDSSANESFRRKARLVSPVSSPETPSPRTMQLPSNNPGPGRVSKSLKFMSLVSQTKQQGSRGVSKSTRTSYSIAAAAAAAAAAEGKSTGTRKQQQEPTRECNCRNPACKLFHDQLEDTQNYLKQYPKIMKKYADYESHCTERIASLSDLIEKVRNEQKGKFSELFVDV